MPLCQVFISQLVQVFFLVVRMSLSGGFDSYESDGHFVMEFAPLPLTATGPPLKLDH
jgi:hypothetical protein